MTQIKPWVHGPLELLHHAEGHLNSGSDFDKRMALISFDNAIEVAITTYLDLHPSQRKGYKIDQKDKVVWSANYHSKLEFLEHYVIKHQKQPMSISRDVIIWYHQLRNELYHAGNGVTPEERNVRGIREAALWVVTVLFDVDAEAEVQNYRQTQGISTDSGAIPLNGQMKFLQSYIEFETSLYAILQALGVSVPQLTYPETTSAWHAFIGQTYNLPPDFKSTVTEALAVRHDVVHGKAFQWGDEYLVSLGSRLNQVTKYVREFVHSVDILPMLKKRYPGSWFRPDILSVRLINREETVFLEVLSLKSFYPDIEMLDLSFIAEDADEDYDYLMFTPERTAQENAERFVNEFGAVSIAHTTDLFVDEAWPEIKERYSYDE